MIFVKDRWVWVYCVDGRSMDPTLNPQDTFLNRCFRDWVLVFRNAEFQKGDIVVLRDPATDRRIVKRLVAQEHEFVPQSNGGYCFVPPGHCWVEGDNPGMSVDSRSFGPVPMGLLDALVVSVFWPFWRARYVDGYMPPELAEE
uniref:Mitochondrial inner membrane protease subunit 2 n=1 Tax=Alexandrium andersonii TaxID=327968 RepID=A0A7S2ADR5_9DINO